MEKVVLEKSTNTHVLETNGVVKQKSFANGTMSIVTKQPGAVVTHGEHGTLVNESKFLAKYVQQEFNPVTKKMVNAFD